MTYRALLNRFLLLSLLLVLSGALYAQGQPDADSTANAAGSDAVLETPAAGGDAAAAGGDDAAAGAVNVEAGKTLFTNNCAACHARDMKTRLPRS